ncbi:putative disease resistance protein RGA3 [Dioscorea cayenensis subsp. rotundata]|uniref:Disease resistance protein RGA3 n=1 Tax=Dioscorea cayennensis subsp. rotundata TaxID=55577 RepID=A0AB40CUD0_DIOCR|nr:putative disease resistance protein RGA3 [Dioscorea cayenensis subsp. rotundata]
MAKILPSLLHNLLPISEAKVRSILSRDFHFILEEKVQTMVQNLEIERLPKIRAIKQTAEIRSGVHNLSLRIILRFIDNVICEAEDVLDEYKYRRLEQLVLRKQHAYMRSFYSYCSSHVQYVSKMEEVVKQLEQIFYTADNCISRLSADDIGEDSSNADARVITTSYLYEEVFGRDKEIEHVTKLLITHPMPASNQRPISDADEDEQNYEILPIIGVEGVGKTVLAKSVYHRSEISQHFDLRLWVHVPEDFDEVSITTGMIQLASKQARPDTNNLVELQKLLSEHIRKKKFLIVLDDVWYDEKSTELANKVRWMRVLAPLRHGQLGSRILVTSPMKLVTKMFTCTMDPVVLRGLEDEACFALFNRLVFGVADIQTPDDRDLILEIGKKIVAEKIIARCSGLPLAVFAVAGMLSQMLEAEEWKEILWSDNSFEDVIRIQLVSFQRLPQHLQRCVAHHSIFPKGMALSRDYLIHSWIGEGLIIDLAEEKNGLTAEDVAGAYLNELVSRSFFQCRDDGLFVLDDMMHDVADFVTKDVCTRIEHDTIREIPSTIRHLRIDMDILMEYRNNICRLKNLRTLVVTCKSSGIGNSYLLGKILKKTKRLRVLRLAACHIDRLPGSIGELQHLRLLDLSDLQVKRLPRSVCRLYHLLYLDLMNFKADIMPGSLSKLINLRRIMSDAATLDRFGKMGELTALQQLPAFSVTKTKGHKIGELKKLNKLGGELRISNLENVHRSKMAAGANLKKKASLYKLCLEWNSYCSAITSDPAENVLDELQPPHQINDLEICHYAGERPPIWMQLSRHSLPCLQVLILNQWACTLPLIGQCIPQLRQLELRDCFKLRYLPPLPLNLEKLLLSGCCLLAILTEADLVKGYAQEMMAGFDRGPSPLTEEEVRITESLKNNDRAMAELTRVKQSLEARGFTLEPSSSSSSTLVASLQSWSLSRKHDAILEKLTSKTQYSIDGKTQPLPSSLQQLHLGNCFVDDSELLNCIRKLMLLTHLVLAGCYCITTLPSGELLSQLTRLQELRIENCVMLTSLGDLRVLPSLKVFNICSCPNLLALIPSSEDEDGDEGSSSVASALLPKSLIDLAITDCELMTKHRISRCLRGLTRLKHLSLQKLKHMTSFPSADELAHLTSIESLTLKDCEELTSLGGLHMLCSLTSLHVQQCPGLLESDTGNASLCVPKIVRS